MEAKRGKRAPPPAPLAVDLAALRLGGERDGARLWRPASGFASRHAAQQQLKQQRQAAGDAVDGEWKTVVAHGRRGRQQLERRTASFVAGVGVRGPPPPQPQLRSSASYDSAVGESRRGQGRRKQQQQQQQEQAAGVPPPAFLGEVMFARRSSLQRLVDKQLVDDAAGKQGGGAKQRKQSHDAGGTSDSGSGPATPRNQQCSHQRRSRHSEVVSDAAAETAAVASPSQRANSADEPPPSKKCGDKRDFFFRNLDYEVRSQLQVDDVAEYSVTDYEMAAKISRIVLRLFGFAAPEKTSSRKGSEGDAEQAVVEAQAPPPPPLPPLPPPKCPIVVTDGTACVGGNVLSFCDHFAHVNAVECDATRVAMLRHNLAVLHKGNATCLHASYLDVMLSLSQDVVFLDPPWGGPEYKELAKLDLFLDGVPLYDICSRLYGYTKCVVLKVPGNFDCEKFALHVPGIVEVHRDLKKMHLVVLDFRDPPTPS